MKSREEGEDTLPTADGLVGCAGEEQSAGDETAYKDASSQTDPRTYSLGGTCHCYSLSVTVLALWVMQYVSFCFQSSRNKQQNSYVAACLSLPSYTCTSFASKFTRCLQQNVNIAYMLSWPSETQSSIPSQSLDCFLLFASGVFNH